MKLVQKRKISFILNDDAITDAPGLRIFGFHANINKIIRTNEFGQIAGDVYMATDSRWTFQDLNVAIKNGDVLRYWIYAQVDGANYRKDNQMWTYSRKIIYINTLNMQFLSSIHR